MAALQQPILASETISSPCFITLASPAISPWPLSTWEHLKKSCWYQSAIHATYFRLSLCLKGGEMFSSYKPKRKNSHHVHGCNRIKNESLQRSFSLSVIFNFRFALITASCLSLLCLRLINFQSFPRINWLSNCLQIHFWTSNRASLSANMFNRSKIRDKQRNISFWLQVEWKSWRKKLQYIQLSHITSWFI